MTGEDKGYKSHKPNSRKGLIHSIFDKEGPEVAWTRGLRERLKENTLRTWFNVWRDKPAPKAKAAKPKVAKSKVKTTNGAAEATA
jgi:hypothetical protein